MPVLASIGKSVMHLFYPRICAGCGNDSLPAESELCIVCLTRLPYTRFEDKPHNPVEKIFAGRLKMRAAGAHLFFSKASWLQQVIHEIKYGGNKILSRQMGVSMGIALKDSGRFDSVDGIVPVPLFLKRFRQRGYNQAALISEGIAEILQKPVWTHVVERTEATETQTGKNRIERWKSMQNKFSVTAPEQIAGKHLLLVDDVVTTGATLEACGSVLLQVPGITVSVVALCYAND